MKYQRKFKKCIKCGDEISLSNYNKHYDSCDGKSHKNKSFKINDEWLDINGKYVCPYCGEKYTKKGISSHIIFKHISPEKSGLNISGYNSLGKKGENCWTKARKNGVEHIMTEKQKNYYQSEKCKNHLNKIGREWWKNSELLDKFKKSIRLAIEKNPEAYSANNVCGRTKIVEYNGFYLNGTWELDVAKWLDKNKIEWTNIIKKGFEYYWEGEIHLYFPDFYLPKFDIFIEVKGYERERDRCKWNVVKNLIILKKNEIKQIRDKTYIAQW